MRIFTALVVWIVPLIALAAPTIPAQLVWTTPESAKAGETIKLSALVYNSTDRQVSVTVDFVADGKTVATAPTTVLPIETAKVVTADWRMPTDKTLITASVRTATDKSKKEVETLVGTIGTVSIAPIATPIPAVVSEKLGSATSAVENARLRTLAYFTDLKKQTGADLGNTTVTEIKSIMNPPTPGDEASGAQSVDQGKLVTYAKYLYASAGKALFANKLLCYLIAAALVFFVVRVIMGRLFRR
jgi:hypothetical protein